MSSSSENDASIRSDVEAGFENAKSFVQSINLQEVKSGEWFIKLLRQVVRSYHENGRAEYLQKKYPGVSRDEIADKLISLATRYAGISGAIAGVSTSVSQVTSIASAGITVPLFIGTLGIEMVYLAQLQMRLILDLSVIYDLQLDPNDPEDIMMVFGYAVGIVPTDVVGKGLMRAAGVGSQTLIKTYISKGTLKTIQNLGRTVGLKILQRSIIKFAVPAVSMAVGGGYNIFTTSTVGQIAKKHFKERGMVSEDLRELITKQRTYDIVFPAAVMFMAKADGVYREEEQSLYSAILSRMDVEEQEQEIFRRLSEDESAILSALQDVDGKSEAETLLELITMMAVCDGILAEEEKAFLVKVGDALGIDVDAEDLEQQLSRFVKPEDTSRLKQWAERAGSSIGVAQEKSTKILESSLASARQIHQGIRSRLSTRDNPSPADAE